MPEPNPEHLKAVIIAINNAPFFKHLSMSVVEIGVGYPVVTLDVETEHMNPYGGIHGGVYAAAIDTAAYWSAYCELPEENGLITIDVKVDFLAPVSGNICLHDIGHDSCNHSLIHKPHGSLCRRQQAW